MCWEVEERVDFRSWHGSAEKEALGLVTAEFGERNELFSAFAALGHHREVHSLGERDDTPDEAAASFVKIDVADQGAVDLDLVPLGDGAGQPSVVAM